MSKATYRRFDPWRAAPVTEESRETILSGHYFDIDRTSFDSRDIGHFDRLIVHKNNGDSVGVIGLTDDGLIPLIEQSRIPVHRWTLEIPAGYEAERLTQFCRFINTPSYSTQYTALFFASGLKAVHAGNDDDALMSSVRYFTPEEAFHMVKNGTILDAKSIIAIQRVYFAPNHMVGDEHLG